MWMQANMCRGGRSLKSGLGLVLAGLIGFGCSSDDGVVVQSFLVSESQAVGAVGLLGSTIAVISSLTQFPTEISAADFPADCLSAAGVETGVTPDTIQACQHVDIGETSCNVTVDLTACTYLDGTVSHSPVVFKSGESLTTVLDLDKFTQGNNDKGSTTEYEFDGSIVVTATAAELQYSEEETVTITGSDGSDPTVLGIVSNYTIDIDATGGTLTLNGTGLYEVGSIGANDVVVTNLVFPLDKESCAGPTSGSLKADLIAFGSAIEGFEVVYTSCTEADLVRFRNNAEVERTALNPVTVAAIFEASIDGILGASTVGLGIVPAASEPFDADETVSAVDAADLWCRFFDPTTQVPLIGELEKQPSTSTLGVAECLAFSANITLLTDAPTLDRGLLAAIFSLEGPLTDSTSIIMLGAHGGAPNWDPTKSQLTPATVVKADVTGTTALTRAAFETAAGAALTDITAVFQSPFVAGSFGPPFTTSVIPDFRCIKETYADPITQLANVNGIQNTEVQCTPQLPGPVFDVDFTRLGMWLTASDGSDGLYIRVVE